MTNEYKTWKEVPVDHIKPMLVDHRDLIHDGDSLLQLINKVPTDVKIEDVTIKTSSYEYEYECECEYDVSMVYKSLETDIEFRKRCEAYQKRIFKEHTPQYKAKVELKRMKAAELKMKNKFDIDNAQRKLYEQLKRKFGNEP